MQGPRDSHLPFQLAEFWPEGSTLLPRIADREREVSPLRRARKATQKDKQTHTWEKGARSCHRIRQEERGKGSYSRKVVKQGKTNTGKDQRPNQEGQAKQVHQARNATKRVGERELMPSSGLRMSSASTSKTYGTRQHCEPGQEKEVKSTLTQDKNHRATSAMKGKANKHR